MSLKAGRYAWSTLQIVQGATGELADYSEAHRWPIVRALRVEQLEAYMVYLQERGSRSRPSQRLSATSLDDYYRTLKTFFCWLVDREEVDANPFDKVPKPRPTRRVIPTYRPGAIERLLRLCDPRLYRLASDRFHAARNRAILYILTDTPARRGELAGMQIDDVDLERGFLRVVGKGSKQRLMPVGQVATLALEEYLDARIAIGPPSAALWVSFAGQPLSGQAIYGMVKRLAARAEVPDATVHRFRHTFSMEWLRSGEPERYLEALGGWRKIPDTYFRTLTSEEAASAHRRVSPGDRLAGAGLRRRPGRRSKGAH